MAQISVILWNLRAIDWKCLARRCCFNSSQQA